MRYFYWKHTDNRPFDPDRVDGGNRSLFMGHEDGVPKLFGMVRSQDDENFYVDWYEAYNGYEMDEANVHAQPIPRHLVEVRITSREHS